MTTRHYSGIYTIEVDIDVCEEYNLDARDIMDQIAQRLLDMPQKGMVDIRFTPPTDKPFIGGPC